MNSDSEKHQSRFDDSVIQYRDADLTDAQVTSIAKLADRCFTDSPRTLDERIEQMLQARGKSDEEVTSCRRFVIWQDERAIAHARTFVRRINCDEAPLSVLALATVCCDPDFRGHGYGAMVTRAAFALVGTNDWPEVSLFQTPVPVFYERLNCRLVNNRFVNRKNVPAPDAYPWMDDTIMVFPAEAAWPSGMIDLNGPSY